jgi:hypothetical protein
MTALLAIIIAAAIVTNATKAAGTNPSIHNVSASGQEPAPRPPRPHSRGPPAPAMARAGRRGPPAGEPVPSAQHPSYPPTTQSLSTHRMPRVRLATPKDPADRHTNDVKQTTTTIIDSRPATSQPTTTAPTAPAVRNQPEQTSGINRNSCPQSPECTCLRRARQGCGRPRAPRLAAGGGDEPHRKG